MESSFNYFNFIYLYIYLYILYLATNCIKLYWKEKKDL